MSKSNGRNYLKNCTECGREFISKNPYTETCNFCNLEENYDYDLQKDTFEIDLVKKKYL